MRTDTWTRTPDQAERERVVAWRRDRLRDAGFGPDLAGVLAADSRVDLHALLQLVERGCPPVLAARILAPMEGEEVHR
jgi:hypothetical protein